MIVGAGHVATQFGRCLSAVGDGVQVYSPTLVHACALAEEIGCSSAVSRKDDVVVDADVYIVAIKDDQLPYVADEFAGYQGLWIHTSGTTPMSVFAGKVENYGVIYPLQTLTRMKRVPMAEVPLFVEANNCKNLEEVKAIADAMGAVEIKECSSQQRMELHIAAVFACNFVNNMMMHAQKLLRSAGTDLTAIKPLIEETIGKALSGADLESVQTGPARRGDIHIIERHLSALDGEQREMYRFVSDSILRHYIDYE